MPEISAMQSQLKVVRLPTRVWLLLQAPGSNVRRWSSMNWYEHGVLVVNRCINEDLIHWDNPDDLVDVDKVKAGFGPRRDRYAC